MQNVPLIELQSLAGGALQEMAQKAIAEVADNMKDLNTRWKPKRMVTIKLEFTQNERRNDVTVQMSVNTKTEPVRPVETKFYIEKDLKSGQIYMEEYGPQIRGQMSLDDYAAVREPEPAAADNVTEFRAKEA